MVLPEQPEVQSVALSRPVVFASKEMVTIDGTGVVPMEQGIDALDHLRDACWW
jgi:hypothetical protein